MSVVSKPVGTTKTQGVVGVDKQELVRRVIMGRGEKSRLDDVAGKLTVKKVSAKMLGVASWGRIFVLILNRVDEDSRAK